MSPNTEAARAQMVSQQVRAGDVLDPAVLTVMGEVPRERFVPLSFRSLAFADTSIPLLPGPGGPQMLTPQVAGRILQALEIRPDDRILEVGTGSGFLTACLGRLGGHVTSLEINPELAELARRNLRDLHIRNCEVLTQDVFQWQPPGPFDCIAVTGSLPVPDHRIQDWLAPGGRLFLTLGQAPAMEAWLIRRDNGAFTRQSLFETELPPLQNSLQAEPFHF